MQRIIIITGPPGSGKSTISKKLAERVDKGVAINIDDIRKMVKAGYALPWLETSESRDQRNLATKNICDIANNSIDMGFDVFIDDIILNKKLIDNYKKSLHNKINFFLLLPSKETLFKRLKDRREDDVMFDRANKLHKSFSSIKNKFDWTIIDNSSLTIEETLNKILKNN